MKEYLSEYRGKNILVTGGAGCIGSNLAKALIKAEAAKIIVVDDLSSAERWNVPVAPNVVFIHGSILDDEVLKRAFSEKVDFVFHLAAHFANQNSVDNPETDLWPHPSTSHPLPQQHNALAQSRKRFLSPQRRP